jgi:hypothetical protein
MFTVTARAATHSPIGTGEEPDINSASQVAGDGTFRYQWPRKRVAGGLWTVTILTAQSEILSCSNSRNYEALGRTVAGKIVRAAAICAVF